MLNRYWRENLILIIIIIIMVGGFFAGKKYWLDNLTTNFEQGGVVQVEQMKAAIKKLTKENFNILLFQQEQYKSLKEFITLPLKIDNRGNPAPFEQ